jgi:formylglycine-generating enzyme required for sulfatase activity
MNIHTVMIAAFVLLAAHTALAADDVAALKQLKAADWTVPGIGMKMKLVPAGTFTMGSPKEEADRREDEAQHVVTLTRPFYVGVYEVRQKEYYDIMLPDFDHASWQYWRGPLHIGAAYNYRDWQNGEGGKLRPDYPMECVTWHKAVEFCKKITAQEEKAGRLPQGYVYRLPTEAEWEYACRAGSKGLYNVEGDPKNKDYVKTFAHADEAEASAVGKKKPNAWGLYDMHGNVYEWCLDWYGPYQSGQVTDPGGPDDGKKKVGRGGCWSGETGPFLRSASRYQFDPEVNFYAILGFRVVLASARH